MSNASAALSAANLRKRFLVKGTKRAVVALDGLSIEIPRGALSAIVGPDGAGKTTFLRLAAGLLKPESGELRVLGLDVTRDPQAVQSRIGYMPQRFGLYEDLSVQENLDLYADLHGIAVRERAKRYEMLMAMTDLARFTSRPAGKLSGGMKQKLGLACTLVRSPELLLLDEPTVGVDPLSRRELWQIVEQLVSQAQLSVLVSTAYLDEAERCKHVLLLRDGKLLASGSPAELRDRASGMTFVSRPEDQQPARILQARLLDDRAHIIDAVPQAGLVRFIRRKSPGEGVTPAGEPVTPRLEDGFMVLLDRGSATGEEVSSQPPAQGFHESGGTVIEVEHLMRKFGDFTAVADTTFKVDRGEVFGLLGPNGAGKTTTFRMLCGLLPPTAGRLRVAGVDMRGAPATARRQIGYVAQKFALYGNLTVAENLRFFAGAYGLSKQCADERIQHALTEFELTDVAGVSSGDLPGGFRQRLAMAAALLHRPEILFLDEPTSGADPLARRSFWRRITALAERGTTVIVTTHFMEEAEYCDRIVIQDAGRILAIGTPAEVRREGADERQSAATSMDEAFIRIVQRARQGTGEKAA